jgi:hypothetical protein
MSGKGMSFLNKKSWHTGGFKMIEKVWKAEQAAAEEQKKIDTLRKEMDEERRIEQLRKLQHEAGLLTKNQLERLDWMYVGQGAYKEQEMKKEQEAFLLGKVKTENALSGGNCVSDIKALATSTAGALLLSASNTNSNAAAGSTTGPASTGQSHKSQVKHELEQASLLRDDPLMAILRQEQARKSAVTSNPYVMKQLKEEAMREKLMRELEKVKKSEAKRVAKQAKKEEKKRARKAEKYGTSDKRSRSRSRSRSHSSNSTSDRSRSRSPKHAPSTTVPPPATTAYNAPAVDEEHKASETAALHAAWSEGGAETMDVEPSHKSGTVPASRGVLYHPSGRDVASKTSVHTSSDVPSKSDSRRRNRSRSRSRSHSANRSRRRYDSRSRSRERYRGDTSRNDHRSSTSSRDQPRRDRSRTHSRDRDRSPRHRYDDSRKHHSTSSRHHTTHSRSRSRSVDRSHRDRDYYRSHSKSPSRSEPDRHRDRDREYRRSRSPQQRHRHTDVPPPTATAAAASAPHHAAASASRVAPLPSTSATTSIGVGRSSTPAAAVSNPPYSRHNTSAAPARLTASTLSAEERAARLAAMTSDADAIETAAKLRASAAIAAAEHEEREEQKRKMAKAADPAPVDFLAKMNASVYSGEHETLAERLNKNKHYRQKGDVEQQSFI